MDCGLFVLDDVQYSDAQDMTLGGVRTPSDTDFLAARPHRRMEAPAYSRSARPLPGGTGWAFADDGDHEIEKREQNESDTASFTQKAVRTTALFLKSMQNGCGCTTAEGTRKAGGAGCATHGHEAGRL